MWRPGISMQSFMERQRQDFARHRVCIRHKDLERLRSKNARIRSALTPNDSLLELEPEGQLADVNDADEAATFEQLCMEDLVNRFYDDRELVCLICHTNSLSENEHGIFCPCGNFMLSSRPDRPICLASFKHMLDEVANKHEETCSVRRESLSGFIFEDDGFIVFCPVCCEIESIC
uniref:RPA_interact_C domain-containing protein n=1 Tax=Trichuris muris TaxID=70415 RepID=A0A5S6QSH5_TRIMR